MDPQHRILLELVWEGLEDAWINPHTLRGTNGSVFLGSWTNDYKDILQQSSSSQTYRNYMGNSIGAAAGRISFLLGMNGPSIATESGCSSAMAAVHLACKSLRLGETNLALACGVNLLLNPFKYDDYFTILSPDGRCNTFSEDANGFARAEGAGVLVLKRMSDALRDGDRIWGLIRGSSLCQEGASNSMGTPTIHCETLVMQEALRDANIQPEQVDYVEAHGTGTAVGDPVEVAAIAKAYNSPERKEPLIIGSVKTNIGHTESCSGIAGIMKVILSMHRQIIPPHRNFTKLNPLINLDAVPAIIPFERTPWTKSSSRSRIAGVSAFGITGTDVHVIIEEPPRHVNVKPLALENEINRQPCILKLSARTHEALDIMLRRYHNALKESKESLADIAYSANNGRANFPIRAALVGTSKAEICEIIDMQKFQIGNVSQMNLGKVCFLFTGQGSQYHGMAKTLYETNDVFRIHFDYCHKMLTDMYNVNLTDVLWGNGSNGKTEITRTIYSQTAIFCVEYALLKVWESLGIKPDYVLGHSLGEFPAAVCAGILCVEDAIKLVAERSKLIDYLPHGKMLVIKADKGQVENEMNRFANGAENKMLDFAAINSNEQTVVAGDSEIVMEFYTFCTKNKLKCMILDASHAFHSKHMDPILQSYGNVARTVGRQRSQKCEYISGVYGELMYAEDVDEKYWIQHTRDKVNFLKASKTAVQFECSIFIEIGPQPILSALLTLNNESANLLCVPSLRKNEEESVTMLNSLAKLYVNGIGIDWNGLDQYQCRKKVRLPHYPFIGKKYWPDIATKVNADSIHPLVGSAVPNATSAKLFQSRINLNTHEYIKDHVVGEHFILPGACYLEMCMAAGVAAMQGSPDKLTKPTRSLKMENLIIAAPLVLENGKTVQVQTVAEFGNGKEDNGDSGTARIQIFQRMGIDLKSSWLSHARATFYPTAASETHAAYLTPSQFAEITSRPGNDQTPAILYDRLMSVGLKFGPQFRSIEKIWREDSNSRVAKIRIPSQDSQRSKYIIHPVILDAMLQAVIFHWLVNNYQLKLYMPIKVGNFLLLSSPADLSAFYVHIYDPSKSTGELSGTNYTISLLDTAGNLLAVMSDVEILYTTTNALDSVVEQQTKSMPDLWEEIWIETVDVLQNPAQLEIGKLAREYAECAKKTTKCWLIFHHQSDTLQSLVDTCRALLPDRRVLSIFPADHFKHNARDSISIRADVEADFLKLLETTIQRGANQLEGIVYGWTMDNSTISPAAALRPYVFLTKAILGIKTEYPRLCLLSRGAVPVSDGDKIDIYSSTLRGFTKSLANENINLPCKCIDLDPKADENEMLTIFYEIWKPEREVQVAHRATRRFVPKLVPYKPSLQNLDKTITANGTYLITGGLGGIGLEVCKWMVKMGARYILLTGRTPPNSNLQRIITKLNDEFGANVKFERLDVSSLDQCKELIQSKIPAMGYPMNI